MAAVIYNCKRCKVGRRVDYPNACTSHRGARWREGCQIGSDKPSRVYPGAWLSYRGADGRREYDGDPLGMCPACARPMAWNYLKGHRAPDVKCDARCTGARGHDCTCSCGGANHGSAWG